MAIKVAASFNLTGARSSLVKFDPVEPETKARKW